MMPAPLHRSHHPHPPLRLATAAGLLLLLLAVAARAQTRSDTESARESRERRQEVCIDAQAGVVEMPVDDSLYITGPNDILSMAVATDRFMTIPLVVSSDGRIVVPSMGEVQAAGRTLSEVRTLLQELVNRNYRQAAITVSLVRARQIKVSVTGAVQRPGVVTLPATSRVSEALQLAGGAIRDTTALRGIVIRRSNGGTLRADITSFLRMGSTSDNPFVQGGDIIYVPRIDERVGVFGAVNYEGHLDFVPGDRLFDCLRLAGGFRSSVFLDSIEIVRYQKDHVTTRSFFLNLTGYPGDQSVNIPMQAEDLVLARAIPNFHRQRLVVITGKVKFPGTYPIEFGKTTLSQIIARAGGYTNEASLEEATVTRRQNENERDLEFERLSKVQASDMREDEYEYFRARSRERVGQMAVNFKKLFLEHDLSEDIILQENDVIDIPIRKNYIRVIGRVNSPGNVIYREEWGWKNYVAFCGGFGWRANDTDVRLIKGRTGELVDVDNEGDYTIEPGDAIWVPEEAKTKFWEVALTTLGILGQIAGIVGIVYAVSK